MLSVLAVAIAQAAVPGQNDSVSNSLVAGGQQPAAAPARPVVITNPEWVKGRSHIIVPVWPAGAYYAHVSGHVVLTCEVNVKGRLEHCRADEESPPGWGFGNAAIEQAEEDFRLRPQLRDGVPVGGAKIKIPINYSWGH